MNPQELRAFRSALAMSGAEFARLVGAADARNVRRWEAGDNSLPGSTRQLLRLLQGMTESQRARAIASLLGATPPQP